MPAPRACLAAASLDGQIYTIGGLDEAGNPMATVLSYSPASGRWQTDAPLLDATDGDAAVANGGHIYVVGGENEAGKSSPPWRSTTPGLTAGPGAGQCQRHAGAPGSPGRATISMRSGASTTTATPSARSKPTTRLPTHGRRELRCRAKVPIQQWGRSPTAGSSSPVEAPRHRDRRCGAVHTMVEHLAAADTVAGGYDPHRRRGGQYVLCDQRFCGGPVEGCDHVCLGGCRPIATQFPS